MPNDDRFALSDLVVRPGLNLWSPIDDRDAIGQVLIAREYMFAAEWMMVSEEHEGSLIRPNYMPICQFLELCLKSFLLNAGVNTEIIRQQKYRHDFADMQPICIEKTHSFIDIKHR